MSYLLILLTSLCLVASASTNAVASLPVITHPEVIQADSIRYLQTEQEVDMTTLAAIDTHDWRPLKLILLNPLGDHIWFRFRVDLVMEPSQKLVLTTADFFTDRASLYLFKDGQLIQKTEFGNLIPIAAREIPYIFPVIPLQIKSDGIYQVLLHTQNRTPRMLLNELSILPERELAFAELSGKLTTRAILVGILVLLLAVILVLLLFRYRNDFAYGSIFLVTSIGTILLWDGSIYPLFGVDDRRWYANAIGPLLFSANAGALLYLVERLQLASKKFVLYIKCSAVALFICALAMSIQDLYFEVFIGNLIYLVYTNAVVLLIVMVFIAVWEAVKGNWRNRLFAAVWLIFVFLAVCRFFRAMVPDFYLGTSQQWSVSLALVGLWLLVEYIWDIAREEFGKRKQQLIADSRIEMVNRLSHEIRTPLNAVIGLADLLKSHRDPLLISKYADMIQSSGKTLLGLVNDILDFSKLGSQEAAMVSKPFRLDALLADTMSHFLQKISEKRLEAKVYIDPQVCLYLLGDAVRVQQIFFNLVNNAIKFTPEQGALSINVSPVEDDGNRVCLHCVVEDSGRGIPEDKLNNIFEPFMQARAEDSSNLKGVGLGLAITKLLVESMGGDIVVESRPGEGTIFRFDLWFEKDQEAPDCLAIFKPLAGKRIAMVSRMDVLNKQYIDYLQFYQAETSLYTCLDSFIEASAPVDLVIVESYICFKASDVAKLNGAMSECKVIIIDSRREQWPDDLVSDRVALAVMPLTPLSLLATATSLITGSSVILPDEQETLVDAIDVANHRVLIVDDNTLNLVVCSKLLESLGVDCLAVDSGARALEILAQESFSLVLLDCEMPVMDGYEVVQSIRLREKEQQLRHQTVVALTAHAQDDVGKRCLQEGMDEVMHKPVSRSALAELLGRYPASSEA